MPTGVDAWGDAFGVQARRSGVPRPAIAEALAEVRGWCAQTGHSPEQAFGDPAVYARTVAPGLTRGRPRRARQHAIAAVAGLFALAGGVLALVLGTDIPITLGAVISVACGTVAVVALRRRLRGHPLVIVDVLLAAAITAGPWAAWPQQLLRVPGWAALAGGLLLLSAAARSPGRPA